MVFYETQSQLGGIYQSIFEIRLFSVDDNEFTRDKLIELGAL